MAENHKPSSTHRTEKTKKPSSIGREPPLKSDSSDDDVPLVCTTPVASYESQ